MSALVDPLEHAWRIVYGHLAPMILHETNNVLTVMAGLRQMMRTSQLLPERMGAMIDDQLQRVDLIMSCIRALSADEIDQERLTPVQMVHRLEKLVQLASKSRKVLLIVSADEAPILNGVSTEFMALSMLCFLLPMIPPRGKPAQVQMGIEIQCEADQQRWAASVNPALHDLLGDPDVGFARTLVRAAGGQSTIEGAQGGRMILRAVISNSSLSAVDTPRTDA